MPIPSPTEIKLMLIGIGLLILIGLTALVMHKIDSAQLDKLKTKYAQEQTKAADDARAEQLKLDQVSNAATLQELDQERAMTADAQARLAAITKHVTAGPGNCITWGFLREIDAAVIGVDPETLAFPAGVTASSCGKISGALLAANIITNYGAAQRNAERVTAWQNFAKQIAAVKR